MTRKDPKVISLNDAKKENSNSAFLKMDGEEYELISFVLSGEDKNGKRVLITWQVSLDEMISCSKVLDVVVHEKVKESMANQ